ncbi:MAG: DUF3570 domain-containing protein [Kofleriaceae bacterium]
MQLTRWLAPAAAAALGAAAAGPARAEDRAEVSTTWFQEQRQGGQGGLTVIHPQVDLGVDVGNHVALAAGYSADAVSGATAAVYAVDAVSSATQFSDTRHEGSLGLGFFGKRSRLNLGATVGRERDYLSLALSGAAAIDLPGKNTTVELSYSHGMDQVCDRDNAEATPLSLRPLRGTDPCDKGVLRGADTEGMTVWRDLELDTAQVAVTQNLSPVMNLQVSLFGQVLRGFQANPYRRVRVGPNEPQEHVPDVRARAALAARLNRYLAKLHAALYFEGRAYSDTWGVNSGTLEMAYSQYLGKSLLLRVRGRLYQQTAATFFKDAFFYETESTAGAYFTGDRELAPVRNVLLGAKLTLINVAEERPVWGVFDKLQLALKVDGLFLSELAADDPAANPVGRDRQFLSADQLFDAFILQLGFTGDY